MSLIASSFISVVAAQGVTDDARQQALDLARQIEDEYLVFDENWALNEIKQTTISPDKQLRLMRSVITSAVAEGEQGVEEQMSTYRNAAHKTGSERDKNIAYFFDDFLSNQKNGDLNSSNGTLAKYFEHEDWFIRHRALYFYGLYSPRATSPSVALQYAQEAFDLIPEANFDSVEAKYAREAKILSFTNLALLHNLLGHPELSMQITREEMSLKKESAEPINGSAIINDLIFAFSVWRDHKTVELLTESLLRLEEKSGSQEPGLTELRASNVYIETGNFAKSLVFANKAIAVAELEGVKRGSVLNRIIALSGLEKTRIAKRELEHFVNTVPIEIQSKGSVAQKLSHIKLLIALAERDTVAVNKYANDRVDSAIKLILTRNNSETANMLASLQDSKERRSEREGALEREAELKQLALDRQRRVIWLLFALAAILAVLTTGATAFARFRSQAAREMSAAADKARAGDKAKSEFLAVMSHELRTPLNGILGMADVLSRTAPNESVKAKNDIILKSGNELLALVENIFDMTLIESGDVTTYPTEVNVHDLITRQTEEWRADIESKDIIFTVYIDPSVPEKMELDRDRFRQCIKNLLSNAAKFTDAGRVHVHVTARPLPNTETATSELTIVVADTGVGISEDAKTRLFKPFVQADYSMTREFGGAGLGLAITQNLARLMDGDVTVNSREGRGSEFTLTVCGQAHEPTPICDPAELIVRPILISNTAPTGRLDTSHRVACFGQKFLIVDDDIPSQNVVQSLLEPTGAHMTCVGNGQAALDALGVDTFDVVIMDIRMPGMDGVTAVRRIRESRESHSNVPIIALTADVTPETNTKCLIAGVNVYLTKPVRAEDFYEAIEYVNERALEAARKQA